MHVIQQQPGENEEAEATRTWRNPFVGALVFLFLLGCAFIYIGARVFEPGMFWNQLLIGTGISAGPAALVALVFRFFFLEDTKLAVMRPIKSLAGCAQQEMSGMARQAENQLTEMARQAEEELSRTAREVACWYREEIQVLRALKQAGVIYPFRCRQEALKDFVGAINEEVGPDNPPDQRKIMIVGSSLKGLFREKECPEFTEALKKVIEQKQAKVLFLLTHPVVADFRARQETRRYREIGGEIIQTLGDLKDWGVPEANVRLFKGTPTIFGIMTSHCMLLDPYPYCKVSFDSPCFTFSRGEAGEGYFYQELSSSHFKQAWDSELAEQITDFDRNINRLSSQLDDYERLARQILE